MNVTEDVIVHDRYVELTPLGTIALLFTAAILLAAVVLLIAWLIVRRRRQRDQG